MDSQEDKEKSAISLLRLYLRFYKRHPLLAIASLVLFVFIIGAFKFIKINSLFETQASTISPPTISNQPIFNNNINNNVNINLDSIRPGTKRFIPSNTNKQKTEKKPINHNLLNKNKTKKSSPPTVNNIPKNIKSIISKGNKQSSNFNIPSALPNSNKTSVFIKSPEANISKVDSIEIKRKASEERIKIQEKRRDSLYRVSVRKKEDSVYKARMKFKAPREKGVDTLALILSEFPAIDEPIIYVSYANVKTYEPNIGGIWFWTDCKDCSWIVELDCYPINVSVSSQKIIVSNKEPKKMPTNTFYQRFFSEKKFTITVNSKTDFRWLDSRERWELTLLPQKNMIIRISKKLPQSKK